MSMHIHIYAYNNSEKEVLNLKESKEGSGEDLRGRRKRK